MVPSRLFDTELAGRLAGFARVGGCGAMVENVLGYALEKGHSAVDWSTRPLPEPWLRYAALDVELLVDLRDALEDELSRQGKLEWAHQEFAAIAAAPPAPPRKDPWRRTSGMHKVRRRRQMAVVRELWTTRDEVAQRRDISPGKVLGDAAIIEAALNLPPNTHALAALAGFGHRMGRRQLEQWQAAAVDRARALPEGLELLPQPGQPLNGPPPPRSWADKDPAAAARLAAARTAVTALAEDLNLPQENLITPDTVRRLLGACRRADQGSRRGRPGRPRRPPLADRTGHPDPHRGPDLDRRLIPRGRPGDPGPPRRLSPGRRARAESSGWPRPHRTWSCSSRSWSPHPPTRSPSSGHWCPAPQR
ncbi:Ribonuclease D [Streptomyces rimosus subsp. rimosus]